MLQSANTLNPEEKHPLRNLESLVESCKMNGIDFGDYIEYVMERMVAGEKDARSLLPNHVNIPADWIPEGQIDAREQAKIA